MRQSLCGHFQLECCAALLSLMFLTFSTAANTLVPLSDMNSARGGHRAILLDDGNVLIIGGFTSLHVSLIFAFSIYSEPELPFAQHNKTQILTQPIQ